VLLTMSLELVHIRNSLSNQESHMVILGVHAQGPNARCISYQRALTLHQVQSCNGYELPIAEAIQWDRVARPCIVT